MPSVIALLSIRRPSYIEAGTVPYLDWGNALTPTLRDQAYPVLAIAWGRTIQLVVYRNQMEVMLGKQKPMLQLDGFYICEAPSIDSVFFISESLLFIIVNKKEVRILYTQNFSPGVFDPNYSQVDVQTRKVGASSKASDEQLEISEFTLAVQKYAGQVSSYAEKCSGYRMIEEEIRYKDNLGIKEPGEQGSKFNFNATVCKNFDFNVIVLGKTQIGQRNLIHWEEYLDLIKRTSPDDQVKVLRTALEIFYGKMIGLAGLPDVKQKREALLRRTMKDLLKHNIDACLRSLQDEECVKKDTFRVAMEFFIRVGATDHVFEELYNMFVEKGVENCFFQNLDVFIFSGKLKGIKIPNKILERLISFYRSKDVRLLEKAILNLDLSHYPDSQSVRIICEEELLSSALIHLLATLFEQKQDMPTSTCLSILCALFNMMSRSKFKGTCEDLMSLQLDSFGIGKLSEGQKIKDQKQITNRSRELKLEVWRSSTYIGYKLMWVITVFLEGKKFPQGSLSTDQWRYYVHDIVKFCTNEKFMAWFLDFDCQTFFQILKKLFNSPEPSEFIRSQELPITNLKIKSPLIEPYPTHIQIIQIVERKVDAIIWDQHQNNSGQPTEKSELLANAMLFFLTQACKNNKIPVTKDMCLRTTKNQILFHKKLFNLPKKELLDLIPDNQAAQKDTGSKIYTILIRKNEKDIIAILVRFQSQLSEQEIQSLIEIAQSAPLFKLRIYLYQLQGDFQKCLSLFFEVWAIKNEIFAWLNDIQINLTQIQQTEEDSNSNFFDLKGVPSRISYNQMKELISLNIGDFVQMDPEQTVRICEQWFNGEYILVADQLQNHNELAFTFLSAVLEKIESEIIKEQNKSVDGSLSSNNKNLLLRLTQTLCDCKRQSVSFVSYVGRSYFPIESCLQICESKGQIEACAVLQRRRGNYKESLKLYIDAIVNLCVQKLIHTVFIEKNIHFKDPLCTNEHIIAFDYLVQQIIEICENCGSRLTEDQMEDLWLSAIRGVFEIKTEVYKIQDKKISNSDSDLNGEEIEERLHFEKFLLIRNQIFMQKMAENVDLRMVINFLSTKEPKTSFAFFEHAFVRRIRKESVYLYVLFYAKQLSLKRQEDESYQYITLLKKGFTSKSQKCDSCGTNLANKWDSQKVWMMRCDHSFHARCITKSKGECPVCPNFIEKLSEWLCLKSVDSCQQITKQDGLYIDSSHKLQEEPGFDAIKQKKGMAINNSTTNQGRREVVSKADKIEKLMQQFEKDQEFALISNFDF